MMGMRRSSRLTAALVAASLIVASPGLPCYQAVAADFEGGAPKNLNIKVIPALDLPAIKTGGIEIPGAGIPTLQTGIPQTGIPEVAIPGSQIGPNAVIPVLPAAVSGLTQAPSTNQLPETAGQNNPGSGAVDRPIAETTLRTGVEAIEGAKGDAKGGILSWFWSGSKKESDASVSVVAAQDAVSGLSQLSVSELQTIASDKTKPSAQRMSAVKAIANRSDDPAKLALEEIGTVKPVGDAQDYEVRRQALRELAAKGKLVSLPTISEEHKQEILAKLSTTKPKNAIFDWDETWEKHGEKASVETGAALKAMADAGVRTTILTGRPYLSRESGESRIEDKLATLTPEQKASFSVLPDFGARAFHYKGDQPVIDRENEPWTQNELALLKSASSTLRFKFGTELYNGQFSRTDDYSYTLYVRGGVNLEDAAADFKGTLAKLGIKGQILAWPARNGSPAMLFVTKYDKSDGVKAVLGAKGRASGTVLVGDYFFGENRSVDSAMTRGAPGALALAVGGTADPRIDNLFVWNSLGHDAAVEIAQAIAKPLPAQPTVAARATGLLSWLKGKWNQEGPKAPGPDDPINVKTLLGNIVPSVISMAAYMLVTLAFVGVAVPVVGWTGYGILMSLSPMAGIAAANIMGNIFKTMGARNAMVINTALRILSLSALPLIHLFGPVGMGALLVGALAEGFLLSSIMTTSGSFLPALFPSKQIGNINGVMFMMFPLVQVLLGIWAHVGRFADMMSPFTIFAGAAALNALIVLPLTWLLIPNTKLTQGAPAAGAAPAQAKVPLKTQAKDFFKKSWKPMLALGLAVGLFAGLTWGLPALAAAGAGGKLIAAAAAFLKAHSSLTAPLPIVGALIYWITRTDGYKALRAGKTAKVTDAENALTQKISDLEAKGPAGEAELTAARAELKAYQGRSLKSIGLMSLSTLMYYPLYLIAAPHVAEVLAGSGGKLELAGQFLGALFFGSLLSTVARTTLPSFKIGGKTVNTTRIAQGAVVALAGLFAATKIFVAGTLLGGVGVAVAAMAAAAGLIYLATRITDRGWIKGAGVGFVAVWLPFVVWSWPALIPFLTIKTAMLLSLLAAGFVNGPNFVSLISYLMSNTERSENSKVTGVQGAFFNAAISTGYALLTIASGFLNPAYPAVLAILGILNVVIGGYFWRTAGRLPGISPTIFKRKSNAAPEAKKTPDAPPAPVITE